MMLLPSSKNCFGARGLVKKSAMVSAVLTCRGRHTCCSRSSLLNEEMAAFDVLQLLVMGTGSCVRDILSGFVVDRELRRTGVGETELFEELWQLCRKYETLFAVSLQAMISASHDERAMEGCCWLPQSMVHLCHCRV